MGARLVSIPATGRGGMSAAVTEGPAAPVATACCSSAAGCGGAWAAGGEAGAVRACAMAVCFGAGRGLGGGSILAGCGSAWGSGGGGSADVAGGCGSGGGSAVAVVGGGCGSGGGGSAG